MADPALDTATLQKELADCRERIARLEGQLAAQRASSVPINKDGQTHKTLFDISRDALLVMDDAGRILRFNEAACELAGVSAEEMGRRGIADFQTPPGHPTAIEKFRQYVANGADEDGEFALMRPDGQTRHTEYAARRDVTGLHIVALRDVTDRRRTAEALRNTRDQFEQLVSRMKNVFWICSAETAQIIYASPAYEEIWGQPVSVAYRDAEAWSRLVHPDDLPEVMQVFQKVITDTTGRGHQIDFRILRTDGQLRWLQVWAYPIADERGKIIRVAGLTNDVTDRKLAEVALHEQHAVLRTILESTSDYIFMKDPQLRYVAINSAAAGVNSRTPEEILGRDDYALFPTEIARTIIQSDQAILDSGGSARLSEYVPIRGKMRHLSTSKTVCRDASGKVIGLVGVARDVTPQFEAEEALRRAHDELEIRVRERTAELVEANERLRAEARERARIEEQSRQYQNELAYVQRRGTMIEMSGGLAHELNQPLAAVLTYAGTCRQRIEKLPNIPKDVHDDLEQVMLQTERASQIIKHLREFLRKRDTMTTIVDLNESVRKVARLLDAETRKARVRLALDLSRAAPQTKGDPIQIEQVLVNLVLNGIDAMSQVPYDDRVLTIRTSISSLGDGEVEVRDCGGGFSEEAWSRLFHPFFTTKAHGLGMGLAISRSIVESHLGRLTAKNYPGSGAALRMTLPGLSDTADHRE